MEKGERVPAVKEGEIMANVEFVQYIDTVKNATQQALMRAAEAIGQHMESHAKLYITEGVYRSPESEWYIRTGNLRNSITHTTEERDGDIYCIVGSAVEYAPYVELGTGVYAEGGGRATPWSYQDSKGEWHTTTGMPPRPFLRPAVERHIDEYRQVLQHELAKP